MCLQYLKNKQSFLHLFPTHLHLNPAPRLCLPGLYHYMCFPLNVCPPSKTWITSLFWWCAHENKVPHLPAWVLSRVEDSAPTNRQAINNWHMKLSRGPDVSLWSQMQEKLVSKFERPEVILRCYLTLVVRSFLFCFFFRFGHGPCEFSIIILLVFDKVLAYF